MSGGLIRRTLITSGLVALIVVTTFVILIRAIVDLRDSSRLEAKSREALAAATLLERLVLDMETGLRGFVITGQEGFLNPWRAARASFPTQAQALEVLASGSSRQTTTVRQISQGVQSYIEDYSLPLIAQARRDLASARTVIATDEGKRRVDALRADFDRFISTEQSITATRHRRAENNARGAIGAASIGLAGSIIVVGLFARHLIGSIVRPVRRAAAMADRLAGGDLGARLPETGAGEIGDLERSFNVMGQSLEKNRAEIASSRARIVAAADETRRRIERDLHDGIQQRLVSLGLELRAAEASVSPANDELRSELSRIAGELGGVLGDLREMSRGIHPAILSEGGLEPAIAVLTRRSPVRVDLSTDLPGRLPPAVEVAAYYVVAEALTNVAKHAGAAAAHVRAEVLSDVLRLKIDDDGAGGADPTKGSGLLGLTDRVEALGGTVEIRSTAGKGTSIQVDLPIKGRTEAAPNPATAP